MVCMGADQGHLNDERQARNVDDTRRRRERDDAIYQQLVGVTTEQLLVSALGAVEAFKAASGNDVSANRTSHHAVACAKLTRPAAFCHIEVDRVAREVTFRVSVMRAEGSAHSDSMRRAMIRVAVDGRCLLFTDPLVTTHLQMTADELLQAWLPLYFNEI